VGASCNTHKLIHTEVYLGLKASAKLSLGDSDHHQRHGDEVDVRDVMHQATACCLLISKPVEKQNVVKIARQEAGELNTALLYR